MVTMVDSQLKLNLSERTNMKPPIGFKALWGRCGVIDIQVQECDVCGKEEMCLTIDCSEEEYGPGCVCKNCCNILFEEIEEELELQLEDPFRIQLLKNAEKDTSEEYLKRDAAILTEMVKNSYKQMRKDT